MGVDRLSSCPAFRLARGLGIVLEVVALAVVAFPATAGPPPPPGGHIPVYFGGANQAGYPPASEAVAEPPVAAAASLREVMSSPNPFRGMTFIYFNLGQGEEARLRIFDLAGRQVRELVHRGDQGGPQRMQWDGRDQEGNRVGSGVYFYQVAAGGRSVTRKLVLLQ